MSRLPLGENSAMSMQLDCILNEINGFLSEQLFFLIFEDEYNTKSISPSVIPEKLYWEQKIIELEALFKKLGTLLSEPGNNTKDASIDNTQRLFVAQVRCLQVHEGCKKRDQVAEIALNGFVAVLPRIYAIAFASILEILPVLNDDRALLPFGSRLIISLRRLFSLPWAPELHTSLTNFLIYLVERPNYDLSLQLHDCITDRVVSILHHAIECMKAARILNKQQKVVIVSKKKQKGAPPAVQSISPLEKLDFEELGQALIIFGHLQKFPGKAGQVERMINQVVTIELYYSDLLPKPKRVVLVSAVASIVDSRATMGFFYSSQFPIVMRILSIHLSTWPGDEDIRQICRAALEKATLMIMPKRPRPPILKQAKTLNQEAFAHKTVSNYLELRNVDKDEPKKTTGPFAAPRDICKQQSESIQPAKVDMDDESLPELFLDEPDQH